MLVINHVEQLCDTYITTKQRRRPFPRQAMYHAHEQLELVLSDLCGPVTPVTPGGRRYFLLLVDDAFLFTWAVLLLSKGAAMGAIKQVQAAAEESGHKLRVLRTDNGWEFTAAALPSTARMKASSATSVPPTHRSRTGSWREGTRRWWPWRGHC